MIKLWIRLETDNKLVKDIIYQTADNYSREAFFEHLTEICYQLNVPVPVILPTHYQSFEAFNNMRFLPRDFVEPFEYDKMIIENALE